MAYDAALAERVRAALAGRHDITGKMSLLRIPAPATLVRPCTSMFDGLAFK